MNILFFLKPKSEVAYVYDYGTLRQVLETMEYHKYACIPMLNREGEYVGTITEGDLLWGIKRYADLNIREAENIFISDFPRKMDYAPVSVDGPEFCPGGGRPEEIYRHCNEKEHHRILL